MWEFSMLNDRIWALKVKMNIYFIKMMKINVVNFIVNKNKSRLIASYLIVLLITCKIRLSKSNKYHLFTYLDLKQKHRTICFICSFFDWLQNYAVVPTIFIRHVHYKKNLFWKNDTIKKIINFQLKIMLLIKV